MVNMVMLIGRLTKDPEIVEKENGIKVPEDMEVVCAIDTKYNSMVRPTISAYTAPAYDLGAVGMRLMTKMLQDEVVDDKEKRLTYLFVARGTTK